MLWHGLGKCPRKQRWWIYANWHRWRSKRCGGWSHTYRVSKGRWSSPGEPCPISSHRFMRRRYLIDVVHAQLRDGDKLPIDDHAVMLPAKNRPQPIPRLQNVRRSRTHRSKTLSNALWVRLKTACQVLWMRTELVGLQWHCRYMRHIRHRCKTARDSTCCLWHGPFVSVKHERHVRTSIQITCSWSNRTNATSTRYLRPRSLHGSRSRVTSTLRRCRKLASMTSPTQRIT